MLVRNQKKQYPYIWCYPEVNPLKDHNIKLSVYDMKIYWQT